MTLLDSEFIILEAADIYRDHDLSFVTKPLDLPVNLGESKVNLEK